MKVNMTPNPLDVVTIHASQGDTEARQWEFELHNNGELIDTSEITEQLFFKAYKGGTEQLLPENGSTPTTSPIIADIKYPQGLLTDQEFLYRESPTEEDGLAKITDIKGNTIVWNQLVQNGNFASSSGWGINGGTLAVANNIATLTANASVAYVQIYRDGFTLNTSHKYLIKFNYNATNITNFLRAIVNSTDGRTYVQLGQNTSNSGTFNVIVTPSLSATRLMFAFVTNGNANGSGTISNVQVFDLTQMGLDITDPSEFTSLFPLSYYAYNQGSLLSFNGTGLKTTGKNEANIPFEQGAVSQTVNFTYQASKVSSATRIRCVSLVVAEKDKIYKCDWNTSIYDCVVQAYGENRLSTGTSENPFNTWHTTSFTFTGTGYVAIAFKRKDGAGIIPSEIDVIKPNLFISDNESTLSLPISTYFPNGMDGVGSDYDELTNTKATTRMTRVDLGSLNWNYNPTYGMYSTGISNSVKKPSASSVRANAISTVGTFADWATFYASGTTSGLLAINTSGYIGIATTETNSTTFKNSLQGVYLVYPLATPIETSFTTASLVTENTEIPLSNNDGVLIGKCTEELSAEPGFHDAKIKLSDSDGTCYSNKLQLHVERKPS